MTEYKTETGMIYAVREQSPGKYRIMCKYDKSRFGWAIATAPEFSAECNSAESLQEVLDAYAQRRGWEVYDPPEASPTSPAAATAAAEEPALPPAEPAPANTTAEPAAGGSEPEERALAANPATYDPSTLGAFDYSGLDAQTVADLHLAEREYASGKRMAEMGLRRMADGVAIAHDALCGGVVPRWDNSKHGNRGEDTFRRWCESIGISKSTAYRMLQVTNMFDQSTPEEQKLLEQLSPSLLYAGAKPSADPEMVQDLKDGKISTLKEWNQREAELKAQLKAKSDELAAVKAEADRRAEKAQASEKEARAAAHTYHVKYEEANAARIAAIDAQGEYIIRATDAEKRAKRADEKATRFEQIKDAALDEVKQAQAQLEAERSDSRRAAAELQQRIRELEARPVEVVSADPDEIDRRAEEKAQAIVAQRSAERTRDRDALQDRIEELEELLDDAAQDQIANTQALAVQAVEACESLLRALFGHILMLPDPQYLPAKRIVESFYAKLGWVLDNNDWPDEDDWALNYSGDDEPDEEEAEEDE